MPEPIGGFFAMWNGMAPDHARDFALMHTRDHLGEHLAYLGEGGILWARRHGGGLGDLPPNFAFYGMASLDRLIDPAHADAKVHETAWFKAVRQHFRDRIAHHCRLLGSAGAGIGSAVATFLVDLGPRAVSGEAEVGRLLDDLTRLPPVTAVHLGQVEWTVPIRVGQAPPARPDGDADLGVAIVEGFDRYDLAAAMLAVGAAMVGSGVVAGIRASAHYGFSYALDHRDLARLRHYRRDDTHAAAQTRP